MTKPYFELHVTMVGDPVTIKPCVEYELGWKFSAIDGDPTLGDGVKCYATTHLSTARHSQAEAEKILLTNGEYLRLLGCDVVREKVELVTFDRISK